ncbi:hypothetical protein [Shewanella loihica]|nr:hypothetical protein [Shewanella loihica]
MAENVFDTYDVDSEEDQPLCVECGEKLAGLHGFCYDCEGDTNDD